jgi:hypothetical protein
MSFTGTAVPQWEDVEHWLAAEKELTELYISREHIARKYEHLFMT